jgi:hypothetical protein
MTSLCQQNQNENFKKNQFVFFKKRVAKKVTLKSFKNLQNEQTGKIHPNAYLRRCSLHKQNFSRPL